MHECNCDHCNCDTSHNYKQSNSGGGAVYGIGIFGAAFYFFPHIANASEFVMAILKSLLWPGVLVYHALSLLKL